jgi:hypothetical protein
MDMKHTAFVRYLLVAAAAYLGAVGLALLLVPVQFGVDAVPADAPPALVAFVRLMAGPFLGVAVLNWMARKAEPSMTLKAVLLANLIGFGVVAGNDVVGVTTGEARDLARFFLVVHVFFTAAFLTSWLKFDSEGGEGPDQR